MTVPDGRPPRVAVVGGGIAGLAAALRLREQLGDHADLTLIEQATRLGGKLRTGELAGARLEAGAESFLVRDADGAPSPAVALARRVGLGDALRHPAPVPAALAVGGRLLPIPSRTLMGVPADPAGLGELARPAADADLDDGRPLLGPDQDIAVGDLVRPRLGDQIVDRLVDPLLGGVYAGRADDLSLAATVPALASACRASTTLTEAVRAALRRGGLPVAGPVFATIDGGMSRLVDAVARATGARLLLGSPVRELRRAHGGWRLLVGSTRDPQPLEVEALVLAVPAAPAARLLAGVSPGAAVEVAELDYASVALVGLALPGGVPHLPQLSGFLVPAGEGYAVKALTIFTTKWPHLDAGGLALLRASVGRYRGAEALRRTDEDLVALVHKELSQLLGVGLPQPVATRVTRWGGALPQYAPGHLDRVARARAALAAENIALSGESLALAGAAYDGVGIPACIRSGWTAADQVADALKGWPS
jgi:protoporphyrinogen/coproporphyrinogen III oxidase